MFNLKVARFTVKQRGGKDPDVQIIRTQYIPIPRSEVIKNISKLTPKKRRCSSAKDSCVTEQAFEDILDRAVRAIRKSTEKN
jgi:hypothetical protein